MNYQLILPGFEEFFPLSRLIENIKVWGLWVQYICLFKFN